MNKIYNKLKFYGLAGAVAVTMLTSCKKERKRTAVVDSTKGIYVLCEGGSSAGTSAITYYDVATNTTIADRYQAVNGASLGVYPNDLQVYGTKMYVTVSGTGSNDSYIDIIDVASCKSLKRIATANVQPRYVAFANGKAYFSNYDGTISRIDTATYAKDDLQLKINNENAGGLEQLAVGNGKIYVAGGSYAPNGNATFNDKVVVVDLATFKQNKTIGVNYGPKSLALTANGDLFVVSQGNYNDIMAGVQKINTVTDEASAVTLKPDLTAIAANGNNVILTTAPYSGTGSVFNYSSISQSNSSFVTDGTALTTPYALTFDHFSGNVVVSDALAYAAKGKSLVFNGAGKLQFSFATGNVPKYAVFTYNYSYE